MLTPTAEQRAIILAAKERPESLMITAFAGCSKTTSLEMLAAELPPTLGVLYLVFNSKNKKEAEKRFPPHMQVKTMNGLGHLAFGRAIGTRLTLDDRKLGKIVTEVTKREGFEATPDQWSAIRELVTAAMQAGLVPSFFPNKSLIEDSEATWQDLCAEQELYDEHEARLVAKFAREALIESIKVGFAGTITFDEQIYLSAMFGGVFPRFALVLVDEAQDLSPLNHIMVKKCAAGRIIVVGDTKQAIYHFRGADSKSMESMRSLRPDWLDLPLATTFRCPKAIVLRQQRHAPGFTAWPTNLAGEVLSLPLKVEGAEPYISWSWKDIEAIAENTTPLASSFAILCRNSAPLLSLAFKLLRAGVPVTMLGREIGKGLVALSKKLLPDDALPVEDCVRLLDEWQSRECALARANGKESKVAGINDRAECLLVTLEAQGVKCAGDLRAHLERLFARDIGRVVLSTIHRAKGLEWDVVVHLDSWRIPSKYAQQNPAQMEQEKNLLYVCETRTKNILIHANLEDYSA